MDKSYIYYINVCRDFLMARPIHLVLTIVLFITLFLPKITTTAGFLPLEPHFLYSFFHANIFHLLGNVLCLYLLRGKIHLLEAYLVAVAVSFIPVPQLPFTSQLGVCGFSAFLFAEVGIRFGKVNMFGRMVRATLPFFILSVFIPYLATAIHVYALLLGFVVGRTLKQNKCLKKKL